MSGLHIDFRKLNEVTDQFDAMDTPYYQVYEGKTLKFNSPILDNDVSEDQISMARDFFETQLKAIQAGGNTATFKVDWYKGLSNAGAYVKDNWKGSNTFKLNEIGEVVSGGYWSDRKTFVTPQMQQLIEENNVLRSRLTALEEVVEGGEEPEEEEESGMLSGLLNGVLPILQRREVQEAIAGRIIGFLDSIMPLKKNSDMNQNVVYEQSVTPGHQVPLSEKESETVYNCLNLLLSRGMMVSDFEKLARLSGNKDQFDNYLKLMRTMLP